MFGTHDLPLFILSGLLLNITPEADSLYIATHSVTQGVRAGMAAKDMPERKVSNGRLFQTCRTGPGYRATTASDVSSVIPSTVACATSIRSNGSLCMGGRPSIATACSLPIGSSL